jgi:hypothetical protein
MKTRSFLCLVKASRNAGSTSAGARSSCRRGHRLGQLDEIRQRIDVGFGIAVAVEHLLPLTHHAEIAVVEIDDLDRQTELLGRSTIPECSSGSTFAGDAGHGCLRIGKAHAHAVGQADTHGAQAARS